jgi:hypothetical protein
VVDSIRDSAAMIVDRERVDRAVVVVSRAVEVVEEEEVVVVV